jgi:hypothetical protein
MTTTLAPDAATNLRDNLALLQANAEIFRERIAQSEREAAEQSEREAAEQSEREAAEQAACSMQPATLVDPAVSAQAKQHGTGLLALMRRWQDSLHKHESVEREVGGWAITRIESDDDLELAIALRVDLEGQSQALTFDGRKRIGEKIAELNAAIADGKARWLYSKVEPVFKTAELYSDSLFSQARCHPISHRKGERGFVLSLKSLEKRYPQTAERITALFASLGAEFFEGEFGASIVLTPHEIVISLRPTIIEFAAPASELIDGFEIVKETKRAVEWQKEREAERERRTREQEEARLATVRADRERLQAELRDAMQDEGFRSELALMLTAPQPIQLGTQSAELQPTITAQPTNAEGMY